jgi:hypothetical protein
VHLSGLPRFIILLVAFVAEKKALFRVVARLGAIPGVEPYSMWSTGAVYPLQRDTAVPSCMIRKVASKSSNALGPDFAGTFGLELRPSHRTTYINGSVVS